MVTNKLTSNHTSSDDDDRLRYSWRVPSFTEMDIEEIANLSVESVCAELRASGLDPEEPLPSKLYELIQKDVYISKSQSRTASLAEGYMAKAEKKIAQMSEAQEEGKNQVVENLREEAVRYLLQAEALEPGIATLHLSCLGAATGA